MRKPEKILCEICRKKFNKSEINVKIEKSEKYMNPQLFEVFFNCPKCGKKYIGYHESQDTLDIQEKIDTVNKKLKDKEFLLAPRLKIKYKSELENLLIRKKNLLTFIKEHIL